MVGDDVIIETDRRRRIRLVRPAQGWLTRATSRQPPKPPPPPSDGQFSLKHLMDLEEHRLQAEEYDADTTSWMGGWTTHEAEYHLRGLCRVGLRGERGVVVEAIVKEWQGVRLLKAAGVDPKRRIVRYPLGRGSLLVGSDESCSKGGSGVSLSRMPASHASRSLRMP